jgi:chemotaxis protein MotB
MVSRHIVLFGLLAVVAFVGGCGSCVEFENQVLALDKQVAGLQEQVVAREADVASLTETRTKLEQDIATLTVEKAELKASTEIVVFGEVTETLSSGVDQYQIQDDMKTSLFSVAQQAMQHPDWDLYVVGHTDRAAQNPETQYYIPTAWELAAFRATAVARYLIEKENLPADRVYACSVGNARLVAPNDNEAGRAQNRRVTFFLRKPEAVAAPAAPDSLITE